MNYFIRRLYNQVSWSFSSKEKILYLTFDDGPIPEVTPWVLEELKRFNAAATFFCIGENVKKHPEIFSQIDRKVHSIGNHTMHHVNGWITSNKNYYSDIAEARHVIHSNLFRPPYGKLRLSQMKNLSRYYRIIMWNVLSKDYDSSLTGEQCFRRVKNTASPGSIIVFHDSLKAEKRLRSALPATLEYFSGLGYRFDRIPDGEE